MVKLQIYNPAEAEEVLKADLKPDLMQLPINILDTKFYRNNVLEKLKFNKIEEFMPGRSFCGVYFSYLIEKLKSLFQML